MAQFVSTYDVVGYFTKISWLQSSFSNITDIANLHNHRLSTG